MFARLPRTSTFLILVGITACAAPQQALQPTTAVAPIVRKLEVGDGTNAYVVMGSRPILVDTGWGKQTAKLEKALAATGVQPRELQLIVLTHGHGDHAGGALHMQKLSGAQVVAGAGDAEMLAAGRNRPLKPMGALGRLIRGFSDKPFPPVKADVMVTTDLDLTPYGINGKVIVVPGHTPGALAVILDGGDAIVGDLVRGSIGSSHSPTRHFFHDDCTAAEAHVATLVQKGVKRFYVGHGGPLDAQAALEYVQRNPCPKP